MPQTTSQQNGFTLVELVVVIILLGILSVYAASRYIGVSSFSPYAAQEQAIAIIKQIQLGRMQYNVHNPDADDDAVPEQYQLDAGVSDSDCLGSVATCSLIDSDEREKRSDSLVLGDNSSLTFSVSPDSEITFDLLGNPYDSADNNSDFTITISGGDETLYLCINSQGYVSRGQCL